MFLKINKKAGDQMSKENDDLNLLIQAYNQDIELNRLKDILDYLKVHPIYIPAIIKISKQKLLKIPHHDLIMILDNISKAIEDGYLPVYSNPNLIAMKDRYYVPLTIYDCFKLMKKLKIKSAIIINPNMDNSLLLDDTLIKYLKK